MHENQRKLSWLVAHSFDVVTVRTDDKCRVVVRVVLRTESRSTVVFAPGCEGCSMKGFDLLSALGLEGQVQMRRPRLWLQANAQRRTLVRTAQLNTQWTLRYDGHTKRFERLQEEGLGSGVVADAKDDVIKHGLSALRWFCEA